MVVLMRAILLSLLLLLSACESKKSDLVCVEGYEYVMFIYAGNGILVPIINYQCTKWEHKDKYTIPQNQAIMKDNNGETPRRNTLSNEDAREDSTILRPQQ
jgi:hypothetical protein